MALNQIHDHESGILIIRPWASLLLLITYYLLIVIIIKFIIRYHYIQCLYYVQGNSAFFGDSYACLVITKQLHWNIGKSFDRLWLRFPRFELCQI